MMSLTPYNLGLFLHGRAERIVKNELENFPILPANGPSSMSNAEWKKRCEWETNTINQILLNSD
jgi:hypothetical protein